jgi:hypothetical protein
VKKKKQGELKKERKETEKPNATDFVRHYKLLMGIFQRFG